LEYRRLHSPPTRAPQTRRRGSHRGTRDIFRSRASLTAPRAPSPPPSFWGQSRNTNGRAGGGEGGGGGGPGGRGGETRRGESGRGRDLRYGVAPSPGYPLPRGVSTRVSPLRTETR